MKGWKCVQEGGPYVNSRWEKKVGGCLLAVYSMGAEVEEVGMPCITYGWTLSSPKSYPYGDLTSKKSYREVEEARDAVLKVWVKFGKEEGIIESFEDFPVREQLEILNKLKPFFEDRANYFGIYEEDIEKLCRGMGWERK
jgi:hypothetical protein